MVVTLILSLLLASFVVSTMGCIGLPDVCNFMEGDVTATGAAIPAPASKVVTDSTTLTTYMAIAAATYCDGTTSKPLCTWCYLLSNKGFTWFTTITSSEDGTSAEIYSNGVTAVVAHRGTTNVLTALADVDFVQESLVTGSLIKVHRGFKRVAASLYTNTLNVLKTLPAGHTTLVITGHSLGGASALLFAVNLTMNADLPAGFGDLDIYTYGQPRVGNQAFADYVNLRFSHNTRVTCNLDIVSHIPPTNLLPSDKYYHHSRENWQKYIGFPKIADKHVYEDATASSNFGPIYNPLDHLTCVGIFIGGCFAQEALLSLGTTVLQLIDNYTD